MDSFTNFLTEKKAASLKHLIHLEDMILDTPGKEIVTDLREILNTLKAGSGMPAQAKKDGAPAVIAGWDPEAPNEFFVGTKAIFNKTPKINKTNDDIDGHHKGGLAVKLKEALKYLPLVIPKGKIVQMDFMYSKADLGKADIDGISSYTFKPNTILYSVPVDSDEGKSIGRSQIGGAVHTEYEGSSITTMKAVYDIKGVDGWKHHKSVWLFDTNVKDMTAAMMKGSDWKKANSLINKIEKSFLSAKSFKQIRSNKELVGYINTYFNQQVRKGLLTGDVKGLYDHATEKFDKAIIKLKSQKGKEKKTKTKEEFLGSINKNSNLIELMFNLHDMLGEAKAIFMVALEKIAAMKTFVQKNDGTLAVVKDEGFVLISQNNIIKLVDRLEFSRNNFLLDKTW